MATGLPETDDPRGAIEAPLQGAGAPESTATQTLLPEPHPEPDTAGAASEASDRPRDEHGRFVSTSASGAPDAVPSETGAAAETPEKPEGPQDPLSKFSPKLVDLARSVYLSDDQIAAFSDPSLLYDAVRGRAASMAPTFGQPTGQSMAQPQDAAPAPAVAPDPELTIDDLALPEIDEGALGEEIGKPIKGLVEYVNKMKSSLVAEAQKLRKQNAELAVAMTQSASVAQTAALQQQTTFWDQLASSVPGLVDVVGRPSEALANKDGPQGRAWSEFAPLIAARAQSQGVPEHLIDFGRAVREAWSAYRAIGNNGAKSRSAPGTAVQPASRRSAAPAPKSNMTPEEDYNARLAALEGAFMEAGGNPFALESGARAI